MEYPMLMNVIFNAIPIIILLKAKGDFCGVDYGQTIGS